MQKIICFSIFTILFLSSTALTYAQQPELGNWELGIKYIADDESNPFIISDNGERSIEFYVHNTETFEVEVSFTYDLPFEGDADGPETEKIQAGDNESFILNIKNIDVFDFDANSLGEMKITASLVSRASIAVLIPENQEVIADLKIPVIHSISIDITDPAGPMNAGTDMILRISITNTGNIKDKVGEVDLSDNCPLLTLDNGLDKLLVTDLEKGQSTNADLKVTASESHPRKNCKLEITVFSNGAMNSGSSRISEDETSITVEPPLTKPVDNQQEPDNSDDISEVVDSNLPAAGLNSFLLSICIALFYSNRNKKSEKHNQK
jgi:hypothetical protein|tara:strand:+ start:916 stop:1881 length:966 start_codon:yes stop_codon:yes gene_type:complete